MQSPRRKGDGARAIHRLVADFGRDLPALRESNVSEDQVRHDYIDPFWDLLGWGLERQRHQRPAERDVLVERALADAEEQHTRLSRPDYLFRIGGFPRFVVEAKKPDVDLRKDRDAIFQAKTYAWGAQIPFAILTDFEEFRLFDATVKPYYDEPERGVVDDFDLRFEDYPAVWDTLQGTFGREAVAGGSLEGLLSKIKKCRAGRKIRGIDGTLFDLPGSQMWDRDFLDHLASWRLRLARALYKENGTAFPEAGTQHGAAKLAEATQRLLDRLVFMRVCEDRGIARWGALRSLVNRASDDRLDLYSLLTNEFHDLNVQYNGYLFKPHFSEQLALPGQLLSDFVGSLYLTSQGREGDSYRFDAVTPDLLGTIYERFLGDELTVHAGEPEARPKPEVRHAKGVYYTPRFVVDSIIRRTLDRKLAGLAPDDILKVKVLDPACGSGSFLIAVFDHLIKHCTDYFAEHPEAATPPSQEKRKGKRRQVARAFRDSEGEWHLAPDFKAALLTSCIHGVDIDAQAVEVTIMSLYLKMLEEKLPPHWQRDWLENELLPALDANIRCGNSLIEPAGFERWWEDQHKTLFDVDEDTRFRVNAFDWRSDTKGFGAVFQERGGFDVILGNPPYIRVQELNKWKSEECEFYKHRYASARKGNYDIYVLFIERALDLLAPQGLLGYICPHKFWQAQYGEGLREVLARGRHLRSVVDFADQQVFHGATTYTALQVFSKDANPGKVDYAKISQLEDGDQQCRQLDAKGHGPGLVSYHAEHPGSGRWVFRAEGMAKWCENLGANRPCLREIADIFVGLQTSADTVFVFEEADTSRSPAVCFSKASGRQVPVEKDLLKPVVRSGSIGTFWADPAAWVLFPYRFEGGKVSLLDKQTMRKRYPRTWAYLLDHEKLLRAREHGKFDDECWWRLMAKNLDLWEAPKVMVPYMCRRLSAFLDRRGGLYFVNVTTGGFGVRAKDVDLRFLTGILNSRLMDVWFKAQGDPFHGGYYGANKTYIENIPIAIPRTKPQEKLSEQIAEQVDRVQALHVQRQASNLSDRESDALDRDIEGEEHRIDELVCELYGVKELPSVGEAGAAGRPKLCARSAHRTPVPLEALATREEWKAWYAGAKKDSDEWLAENP